MPYQPRGVTFLFVHLGIGFPVPLTGTLILPSSFGGVISIAAHNDSIISLIISKEVDDNAVSFFFGLDL